MQIQNSLEDDVNYYIAHVFKGSFEIDGKKMKV